MELAELIRMRRSIRKYRNEQIPRDALEKIIEAGLYAPNAGGRQGTLIVAVHDRALAEKIGRMNLGKFDRSRLLGSFVSKEQPSAIDDPTIRNGFYGAPTVCAVFCAEAFFIQHSGRILHSRKHGPAGGRSRHRVLHCIARGGDVRQRRRCGASSGMEDPGKLYCTVFRRARLLRRPLPAAESEERRPLADH